MYLDSLKRKELKRGVENSPHTMTDLVEKIAFTMMTRVAIPIFAWGGRAMVGVVRRQSLAGGIALGTAGFVTTVVVAVRPEESFDFVLRQLATLTNYTGLFLQAAANQIRVLEKADLEGILSKPLEYIDENVYSLREASEEGSESETPVPTTSSVSKRYVARPPAPKNYTIKDFPYFISPFFTPRYMGDEDADKLIRAYNNLDIDVVSMILADFQLPQMSLIREIYYYKIRQSHPDRTLADTTAEATMINLAYTEIKSIMSGPETAEQQYELLRTVLQKTNKSAFPTIPYVYLFVGGMLVVVLLWG